MIRVLLAEDQAMMRGRSPCCSASRTTSRSWPGGRGAEVVAAALAARPDVALLDIEMPGGSGLDAAAALADALPACRVLIVTTFGRPGYLRGRWRPGSRLPGQGRAGRGAGRRDPAGRWRASGGRPRAGRRGAADASEPLTARERDVLAAAESGSTVADIAGSLHLSQSTVRNYLSDAIGKTGTRNKTEAALLARRNGWL